MSALALDADAVFMLIVSWESEVRWAGRNPCFMGYSGKLPTVNGQVVHFAIPARSGGFARWHESRSRARDNHCPTGFTLTIGVELANFIEYFREEARKGRTVSPSSGVPVSPELHFSR